MKSFTRLSKLFVTLFSIVAVVALGTGQAMAFTDGQINGGDIYRTEDLTQNTGFSDTTAAQSCDLLEYRVRLYNPGSATVNNVNVQADVSNAALTSNESTIQITSSNGDPSTTFGFTTVTFSTAQTLSYVNGTTQLLNQNNNLIENLTDGITIGGTGVNVGSVGPSVTEYVQFQEKVSCQSPRVVAATCNSLSSPVVEGKTVNINNVAYTSNSATVTGISLNFGNGTVNTYQLSSFPAVYTYPSTGKYTITATVLTNLGNATSSACSAVITTSTTTTPTTLVNTGPGSVAALFTGATVAGTGIYYWLLRRRLANR